MVTWLCFLKNGKRFGNGPEEIHDSKKNNVIFKKKRRKFVLVLMQEKENNNKKQAKNVKGISF